MVSRNLISPGYAIALVHCLLYISCASLLTPASDDGRHAEAEAKFSDAMGLRADEGQDRPSWGFLGKTLTVYVDSQVKR
jgi:hypothetical protein